MWSPPRYPTRPQGLQRLLPPDRRHRRCHRRHARRLGRGLRLRAAPTTRRTSALGSTVTVTGAVSEFFGLTEITATERRHRPRRPEPAVTACVRWPTRPPPRPREAHEGELLAPTDTFTVTNSFNDQQLRRDRPGRPAPSRSSSRPRSRDSARPRQRAAGCGQRSRAASSSTTARRSTSSSTPPPRRSPLPWLDPGHPIRVGAKATFRCHHGSPRRCDPRLPQQRWKFQPQQQVTDTGADGRDLREHRATPTWRRSTVGGDLKLATFNVLNYFNTTGEACVAAGRGTLHLLHRPRRRRRSPTTPATPDGPAWRRATTVSLTRQQAKIVTAINTLDADIVSLEEIENSVKLGEPTVTTRLAALVDRAQHRRRQHAGGPTRPSPSAADLPAGRRAGRDPQRRSSTTRAPSQPVGASKVLLDSAAVRQRPRAAGPGVQGRSVTRDSAAFAVIVNHFKSKGASGAVRRQRRHRAGRLQRRPDPAGRRRWRTSPTSSPPTAASRRSSSPVTSTPTRRKTRCRSSTTRATTELESDQTGETTLQLQRSVRLARPRARQRGRASGWSPAPTSGRSTPTSRWPSSTAASTTT